MLLPLSMNTCCEACTCWLMLLWQLKFHQIPPGTPQPVKLRHATCNDLVVVKLALRTAGH